MRNPSIQRALKTLKENKKREGGREERTRKERVRPTLFVILVTLMRPYWDALESFQNENIYGRIREER